MGQEKNNLAPAIGSWQGYRCRPELVSAKVELIVNVSAAIAPEEPTDREEANAIQQPTIFYAAL